MKFLEIAISRVNLSPYFRIRGGVILTPLMIMYLASYFFLPKFLVGRDFLYDFVPAWSFSFTVILMALLETRMSIGRYIVFYFLFTILCFFSITWSIDPSTTYCHAQQVGAVCLVLPGIWFYCSSKRRVYTFLKSYVIIAVVAEIIGFVFDCSVARRYFLGQSSSGMGILFGVAIIMTFLLWLLNNNRRWLLFIPILFAPIVVIGSIRGALLALVVFLMYIMLGIGRKFVRFQFISVGKLFLLLSLIAVTFVLLFKYIPGQFAARINRNYLPAKEVLEKQTNTDIREAGGGAVRVILINEGISYLRRNPSFFGEGLASSYAIYQRELGLNLYSHTNYIELLMGLGWVGTILFYSMFFCFIFQLLFRNRCDARVRDGLLSVVCSLLLLSMSARIYSISACMMVFMVAVVIYHKELNSLLLSK